MCILNVFLIKDLKVLENSEVTEPHKEHWNEEMQITNYRMNGLGSKSEIKLYKDKWKRQRRAIGNENQLNESIEYELATI